MTGMFKYPIADGDNTIGKAIKGEKPAIVLSGVGIGAPHCVISYNPEDRSSMISPNSEDLKKYKVMVNGELLIDPIRLTHRDRILIGSHFYYQFVDPMINADETFEYDDAVKEANKDSISVFQESEDFSQKLREMEEKIK